MLPNSGDQNKQLNIPIRSDLKDELTKQVKQSGSTLKVFVEQILEDYINNSISPDKSTRLEPRQLPQHNLSSTRNPMDSQFSLDQVLQLVIERLSRVEQHCARLMFEIQGLQVLKNYQPILNQLDTQINYSIPENKSSLTVCDPVEDRNKLSDLGNKGSITDKPEVYSENSENIADLDQSTPKAKTKVPETSATSFNSKKASKFSTSASSEFSEWMTAKEAHEFACQQGYKKKIESFRRILQSADYNQHYAHWGLFCDLNRKELSQRNTKYFRHLSELEKQSSYNR